MNEIYHIFVGGSSSGVYKWYIEHMIDGSTISKTDIMENITDKQNKYFSILKGIFDCLFTFQEKPEHIIMHINQNPENFIQYMNSNETDLHSSVVALLENVFYEIVKI